MSEAVNVNTGGGIPRIQMDVGGQTRYATYSAGSGTSSLTFSYTATPGDLDLDGITLQTPLQANGGVLTDLSGNVMTDFSYSLPNTSGVKVDYPSLSMDFVADSDGRFTVNGTVYNDLNSFITAASVNFFRPSIATYYDSGGILRTASTHTPRIDYNPNTLSVRGLLIEQGRTNQAIYSDQFQQAAWVKTQSSVTSNAAISPDGTSNADFLIPDTNNALHSVSSGALTATAGNTHTASIFAKANGYGYVTVEIIENATSHKATFNLSGCSLSNSSGITNNFTQTINNGWCRVGISAPVSVATAQVRYYASNNTSFSAFAGDASSGIALYGAQFEISPNMTSYVPTAASTVGRNSEGFSLPGGAWLNGAEGTIVGEAEVDNFLHTDFGYTLFALTNGTAQHFVWGFIRSTTQDARGEAVTAASQVANFVTGDSFTAFTPGRIAMAYKTNSFAISGLGNPTTNDSGGTSPTLNLLVIGTREVAATNKLHGHARKISYYPQRAPDAQLPLLSQ
ncbi:MAG: hypothetical protein KDJ50_05445 [Alphaproteobacteria bacterium]|nr:hypothetical protein [Alphaproteobacteria bacterium]